jgi:hypothetical protein|eukprot:COSAG06_NODE_5373_length_3517_cov_14.089819_2_plen_81_part_00
MHHFTQTGSGQTQEKLSKEWRVSQAKVVYGSGSGYSDSWLIGGSGPGGAGARLQVAFQRTLFEANAEGGAYNMGFSIVDV